MAFSNRQLNLIFSSERLFSGFLKRSSLPQCNTFRTPSAMATIATYKVPKIENENNVRGSSGA